MRKKITVLILAPLICLFLYSQKASASATDCQGKLITKLNASSIDIASVNRMCGNISPSTGFLGTMWFDKNSTNDYSGNEATDKITLKKTGTKQTLTAHGYVVFDDDKDINLNHTYATRVALRVCQDAYGNDKMAIVNNDNYTSYKCGSGGTEKTITTGIYDNGNLFSSSMTIKPTNINGGSLPEGWGDCSTGSTGCPIHGHFDRGSRSSGTWSSGGYKSFKINTEEIMNTYFRGKDSAIIYVYRCMGIIYNPYHLSNNGGLAVGTCGYDPSVIKISSSPDPDPITCPDLEETETDIYTASLSVNQSSNPYILDKNTDSTTVNFSYNINLTSGSGNILNEYRLGGYNLSDFSPPNPSSEQVNLNNGEQRTITKSIRNYVTYIIKKTTPQTNVSGSCISGSPTYSLTTSPSVSQISSELTLYREGESLIETRTDLDLSGDYTANGSPIQSKQASSDGNYSSNPNHLGYNPSDPSSTEPKIFANSKNTDIIKLNFTHYLKRKLHPYSHDTQYTLSFPWNTYNTLTDGGSLSLNSPDDWKLAKTGTKNVSNDSGELNLGTYNKEFCNSISSDSTYKITYGGGTNDTRGIIPIGADNIATVCAHLYRPWNYKLSIDKVTISGAENGSIIAGNGSLGIGVTVKNEKNNDSNQEGNPSYSPDNTTIKLYRYIYNGNKNGIGSLNNILTTTTSPTPPLTSYPEITALNGDAEGSINYEGNPNGNTKTVEFIDTSLNGAGGEAGSHICYFASVNHKDSLSDTTADSSNNYTKGYGSTHDNYIYSPLACFTLVGYPTASIKGGSVYSDGEIHTKITSKTDPSNPDETTIIGSWSDFGVVGKKDVLGLASGNSLKDTYDCDNHLLTVNNDTCSGSGNTEESVSNIGNNKVATTNTRDKLINYYSTAINTNETTSSGNSIKINNTDAGYYCFSSSNYSTQIACKTDSTANKFRYLKTDGGVLTVPDHLKLDAGVTFVIYSTKNLTIATDLKYKDEPYENIKDIPQYIIISDGDINIAEGVANINAWLIAKGNLNTCTKNDGTGNLPNNLVQPGNTYDKDTCNSTLSINGPVFANKVNLDRTSGNYSTKTAESFDLTPFSYYWAYWQARQNGNIITTYLREIPPRY